MINLPGWYQALQERPPSGLRVASGCGWLGVVAAAPLRLSLTSGLPCAFAVPQLPENSVSVVPVLQLTLQPSGAFACVPVNDFLQDVHLSGSLFLFPQHGFKALF